jgi:hypothetical protein
MIKDKVLTFSAELLDVNGDIHWRAWNTLGTVSATCVSDGSSVPLSITVFETNPGGVGGGTPPPDSIRFYNGRATVSIVFDAPEALFEEDIELAVNVSGLTQSKVVTLLDNTPANLRELSGTLAGDDLYWSPETGVVHLVGTVTVPDGAVLSIEPGSLVMVDSGSPGNGVAIVAAGTGTIDAQGTDVDPIFFFPSAGQDAMILPQSMPSNPHSWRGFVLSGSASHTFSHVILTGAGNGVIGTQPRPKVFAIQDSSSITMTDCLFSDCPGMLIRGEGSGTYDISNSHFARCGVGAEFVGSGYSADVQDCWFTRIGRAEVGSGLNGNALYIAGSASTQTIGRCVLTDCGRNLIDQMVGASPAIQDCLIYDAEGYALTADGTSTITMTNSLVFDASTGIDAGGASASLLHCTFSSGCSLYNADCGSSYVASSIFYPETTDTCCGSVNNTLIGDPTDLGCGVGNLSADPLFLSPAGNDYNLHPDSPAVVSGPGGARIGWLAFPAAPPCTDDSECNDGVLCTIDRCHVGVCVYGSRDCSAYQSTCTFGVCNETTGLCEAQYLPNGTPCPDGLYCNGAETCVSGTCVAGSTPCVHPCEWCDETSRTCRWCILDIDGNEWIASGDFGVFAGCYGACYETGHPCLIANFDGSVDGCVGSGDFGGFAGCYGQSCSDCPNCSGVP